MSVLIRTKEPIIYASKCVWKKKAPAPVIKDLISNKF